MVQTNFIFIGLLLLVAIVFAAAPLVLVVLVAPRKRTRSKGDTYECGLLTTGETWVRFRIQYFIYALLFVVFDIEAIFLYPWAVSYRGLSQQGLGLFVLIEMVVFLVMLVIGLAYAWARGALRWQ
jgi:NADH-quinone oxidoreductase subunit A